MCVCVCVCVCRTEKLQRRVIGDLGIIYLHIELMMDLKREGLKKRKLVSPNLLGTPNLLIIQILPKI